MSGLSISDRRAISDDLVSRPDFRDLLRIDAAAAIWRSTGHDVPGDTRVTVIEEQPGAWEFVVPSGAIEADLPPPADARGVVETAVYTLLRDEPAVRSQVISDPKRFLLERLQLDIGSAGVNVREEASDELLLILPLGDSRDELSESALDLVAGGSNPDCQNSGSAGRDGSVQKN